MRIALLLLASAFAALGVVGLVWRSVSRRRSLPCPHWLAWGLETPLLTWIYPTRTTLDRIGLKAGLRVLEIGCGPGRLIIPAAQRVRPHGEAVGLDIQAEMIRRLRDNSARAGTDNLIGLVGDVATVALAGPFDIIFIALALGEIPDRVGTLRRCLQLLRPRGVLSITEMLPDPHFVPKRMVRELAEHAGFQHQATHGSALYFTANFVKPAP